MISTSKSRDTQHDYSVLPDGIVAGKKNLKLMEINYRRNMESDYTERMIELYKSFDYERDRNDYWLEKEFSLAYGSPLYEQASDSQKLALNHLYWVCFYNYSIGGEVSTMVYNQLTAGALYSLGGYGTLCRELDLETGQERDHVDSFRKIGGATEMALMGEQIFDRPIPKYFEAAMLPPQRGRRRLLRNIPMLMHAGCLGYSPFLATQYYVLRGLRNIQLKVKEYQHSQFFEKLSTEGRSACVPTAISHYHYLDEGFHTATSQIICHELYKDFKPPTRFEVALNNGSIWRVQSTMNQLSAIVPGIFTSDRDYIPLLYRTLQSRLFGMSPTDALEMTRRCVCEEHEGFHVAAKYHHRAWTDNRSYVEDLEHISKSNRTLTTMGKAKIKRSLKKNCRDFRRFAKRAGSYDKA